MIGSPSSTSTSGSAAPRRSCSPRPSRCTAAGHEVWLYTSHHDQSHSFAALRAPDGELSARVRVLGDWLPRSLFGRAVALCSVVRMLYIALALCCVVGRVADVIFCDGVSAPVPLLRLRAPVLFYCHFPDKLLVTRARSALTRAYRLPLDWLEEATTGCADVIAVNSRFTARIFRESFARVGARRAVEVLYPAINFSAFAGVSDARREAAAAAGGATSFRSTASSGRRTSRSRSRRARARAPRARRARARARAAARGRGRLRQPRGRERRAPRRARGARRRARARRRRRVQAVDRRRRARPAARERALRAVHADNEHFGIVPIEAMYVGAPVVAVASGGPLETVKRARRAWSRARRSVRRRRARARARRRAARAHGPRRARARARALLDAAFGAALEKPWKRAAGAT